MKKLNSEEEAILKSVESGEWKSKGNIDIRIKSLQSSIKNQKKTAISIRLGENDIYELKKKRLNTRSLTRQLFKCLFINTLPIKSSF